MTLARHFDPKLTAGRYARTRFHDLGGVVNKLPARTPARTSAPTPPTLASPEEEAARQHSEGAPDAQHPAQQLPGMGGQS